ncbi:MAG: SDR family oxidoreductase [Candidatus Planktophila sp.]
MTDLVVLTGPTGCLGRAILKRLLSRFLVVGVSRSATQARKCLKVNESSSYYPLDRDFTRDSAEDVADAINQIISGKRARLVGLVNNAFSSYPDSPLAIDENSLSRNAEGLFGYHVRLSLLLSDVMDPPASIVNITSMYGKVSPRPSLYEAESCVNPLLYGCMKAALMQSSRYLSSYLGPKGIRVNSVSYGPFPSDSILVDNPSLILNLAAQTHLGRVGRPDEASGIIEFLLSDSSTYITGADISVDGGWTAW